MPHTDSPNVITTSGTAMGASSTCSSRKNRGNARNAASGVRNDIASHRPSSATSHTTRAQVGKCRCAAATPAPYQARKATARIVTGTSVGASASSARTTTKSVSPTTSRCSPSRSVRKTGRRADGATRASGSSITVMVLSA